jgi:hypothetical protein
MVKMSGGLLGCDTVLSCRRLAMFQRNISALKMEVIYSCETLVTYY